MVIFRESWTYKTILNSGHFPSFIPKYFPQFLCLFQHSEPPIRKAYINKNYICTKGMQRISYKSLFMNTEVENCHLFLNTLIFYFRKTSWRKSGGFSVILNKAETVLIFWRFFNHIWNEETRAGNPGFKKIC